MKPTYTKLAADGTDLPADHPNDGPKKHLAVRVTRADVPGWSATVSAYRCSKKELTHGAAMKAAAKHDANGWQWRPMTVVEGFLTADRTNPERCLDKNFFPDAEEYETTWTSDVYAPDPSGCAWFVDLSRGDACWGYQGYRNGVRAVCAGQS